jgi:two-component system cell cycle sensor histidine kinase/response regulator CckA
MRILHLEDNLLDAELVREVLRESGVPAELRLVDSREAFLRELHQGSYDVILSDYTLPGFLGLEALTLAQQHSPDTPFVFFSGSIGEDRAIEAVKAGAADYVLKDRMKRLGTALQRAVREAAERRARLQAEQLIRNQADIINRAPLAIVITDLEGRITYGNAGAARLYGVPVSEALGRMVEEFFPTAIMAKIAEGRAATTSSGQWTGELPLHTRDGRDIIVELHMSLIRDDADQPRARLTIASDITERKKLEQQFLRAQRMENLGLLAAGIAHDFNNILTPMLMVGPMLRERVKGELERKLLTTVENSAERGAALVRQILSFAHGSGSDRVLVQPKHLLRDILSFMEETFPRSLRHEHDIPSDLWPVKANPTQLHQVLLNLCVNARDAMPQGGTLRLVAGNCALDSIAASILPGGRPGNFVRFDVTDTGTGIPPEVLEHIWEPFFTTKDPTKGTGLGLSTVRGIVGNHDGFCVVRTAVGEGTTFSVYLPAAEAVPAIVAGSVPPFLPRGAGELVLIVDDEANVRDLTSTTLAHHGYRVLTAGDGVEGLALFTTRQTDIGLVITDRHMPNLGGEALAYVLRRLNPKVPLLVISGLSSASEGSGEKADDIGDGFLLKPFKPDALLVAVHRLLHR